MASPNPAAARANFLQSLNALMGSGQVRKPDLLSPTGYVHPTYRNVVPEMTPLDPAAINAEAGPAEAPDRPWWRDALNTVGATGATVTDQLANWTDGGFNWKDSPFAGSIDRGMASQMQGFEDLLAGNPSWNSVPFLGFLSGVGQGQGFSETLKNTGVESPGVQKWGGLAGDIVLDPLNFLTFGGASAAKAGKAAMAAKQSELAKGAGVAAKGNVPQSIADATRARYADNAAINPDLVERLAKSQYAKADTAITNAGKSARASAQNAAVNFDVPFTNITRQFGQKGDGLRISDQAVGALGAIGATNALSKIGIETAEDVSRFLSSRYGVSSPEELTTQMLDDLLRQADSVQMPRSLPDMDVTERMQTFFQPNMNRTMDYSMPFNPEDFLKTLDPRIADRIAPFIRGISQNELTPEILGGIRNMGPNVGKIGQGGEGLEMFGEALGKMPGTIKGKTAEAIEASLKQTADSLRNWADTANTARVRYEPFKEVSELVREVSPAAKSTDMVKNALKQTDEFVMDAGGRSKIGVSLAAKNPFNARTFGAGGGMLDKAAGALRDTETKIFGQSRQMDKKIQDIAKKASSLTTEQKQMIPHIIEGTQPSPGGKIDEIVSDITNVLQEIGQRDLKAGTVDGLLEKYFPHVIVKSQDEIDSLAKKYADDPEMMSLLGRTQGNNFGQSRKSFETLAQLDKTIEQLQNKFHSLPDGTPEKDALGERIKDLQNLFVRDPFEATAQRAYKSIRASAMADLFSQWQREGLIALPDGSQYKQVARDDFQTLNKFEADQLGLEDGTMIQKDVYQGLQKLNGLLTDSGMQKLLDKTTTVVNVWRSLVTTAVPAHYVYNFIGNVANNMLAGAGVGSYKEAASLLRNAKAGKLSADEQRIMQEAVDRGVISQGFSAEFVKSQYAGKPQGFLDKLEDTVTNNAYSKTLRKGGDLIDDFSRLALFMHGMKQTRSAEKAGEMVRRYLFNYHEQSNADKFARAVAPFWMWTKNNMPLQLVELFRQPRHYQAYNKLQEEFTAEDGPDWMQDAHFQIPGTNYAMNPRLPLSDLDTTSNPLRTIMGMQNPLLKIPQELGLNKQYFNGNPIDWEKTKPDDEYDPAAIMKYLGNQSGVLGKVGDLFGDDFMSSLAALFVGKPAEIKQQK